jgi:RNA polymerase sigma-70 factor, ECF subfamily
MRTDEELVIAIQHGDILSYEELVKRYQHGLYVFIMRYMHDEAWSRDIVQNALVKVYECIDRINPKKKFSTFVFEIAKNAAISDLRRRRRHISLEKIVDLEEEVSFVEDFYRADVAQKVRTAVGKLSPKYRDVISLYYFEDLSYEDIGKRLHIPVNTVRTHLKRGKEQLKLALHQYEND